MSSQTAPAHIDLPPHYGKGLRFCRGDTIKVRIPITGTPPPQVEWLKKNKPLEQIKALASRLDITGTHLHTTLIIDDCVKSDEGIYTLQVKNELGASAVDIPISVVGECWDSFEKKCSQHTKKLETKKQGNWGTFSLLPFSKKQGRSLGTFSLLAFSKKQG